MNKSFKRLLSLVVAFVLVLGMVPAGGLQVFAAGTAVAKVGNTEYATIDEAIAAWTNGTTLTLLADVTLSDVIKLSSTEYHILNLGTYTMTAAKNKDAIQYVINGRSSAGYALDIKADATNPGGITATGGSVVRHTKPLTGAPSKDRPITRFYGGVFNASYVVRQGGTFGAGYTGASAPYFQFYGGEFNGTIYTNRSQNQFHGGTFNGSMQMSVDSSAYTLIAGGTFKNLSNSMGSALNSDKFVIGTAKGANNGSVCIDENGYYVVTTTTPVTAEASVASNYNSNNYFYYSTVNTDGMYYEDVYDALEANKTGEVTVFTNVLDMADVADFTGTIVVPEGHSLTITNAPEDIEDRIEYLGAEENKVPVTIVKPAAKIGEQGYETLAEALTAAAAMTGDVTVEIYDKVTLNSSLSGSFDSINFVGKSAAAEIYLDVQGYITATGKKVAFESLTLSKAAGGYMGNAGFMNVAFGVYDVAEVTYTDCTFANGAYASSGEVTYTGCTFKRSHDKYGLWAYGNVDVTVDGCTFDDYRGIKMYAEGAAKTVDLTVKNTDFSAVNDKPAIVLTYGESVTLENNTYSSTGAFELDLDGAPNGTAVSTDVYTITCKNDNGACGVLVDGKIYTTVAQAAEVATSGSTVILLYNPAETVELAEGVILNKNGYTADGVSVAAPAVAKVGDDYYTDLQEAIVAAAPSGTVELLSDVTVDKWIMISQSLTIGSGQIITVDEINGLTIDGNGYALTVKSIESAKNGGNLFYDATELNIKDLTINYVDDAANAGGIGLTSGTIENVTFNGGVGVFPGTGDITITGCTFNTNGCAIYNETDRDNLVVTDNTFNTAAGQYAIYLRGNTTFTNNEIISGKVNVTNSATGEISGNDFNDERFKVYNGATATITNNTINNLVFNDETDTAATFSGNTLSESAQAALDAVMPGLKGTGTEEDPFLIENLEDLIWFRDDVNAGNTYAGKFVKLTADINLNQVAWTSIKQFNGTFDGDNHIISNLQVAGSGNVGFFAQVADQTEKVSGTVKNVTFQNATITSSNGEAALIASARLGARISNVKLTGEVAIQGYRGVGGIVGAGFPVMDGCSVEATGTITATYWGAGGILGFASDAGAKVTNSTIIGTPEVLTIHGELGGVGAVTGTPYGAKTNGAVIRNVNLTSNNNYYMAYADASGKASNVTVENAKVLVNGQEIIGNDAVASVDGAIYFDLQSAVDAAGGKTVKVLRDIELTETVNVTGTVVLELNGKTISGVNSEAKASAVINNTGDLTIQDSVGTGKITSNALNPDPTNNPAYANNTINNRGKLTVKSGTVENASTGYACYAIDSYPGAVTVIEGGVIQCVNGSYGDSIRLFANSTTNTTSLLVTGGAVGTIWAQNPSNGKATDVMYDVTIEDDAMVGTLYLEPTANWEVEITGGQIGNVVLYVTDTENAQRNASAFITGGKFSNPVAESFCAEGYIPVDNGDGTYGVKVGKYVAELNGTKYETFDAAYNAAKTGDTIVLLETAVLDTMFANYSAKTVTVKAEGLETAFLVTKNVMMGTFNGMTIETDGTCITFGTNAGDYNPTVDIYGGTYKGGTSAITVVSGLVRIMDGTFSATNNNNTIVSDAKNVTANGGKYYNFDPINYIPANRFATKGTDGYYTVVEAAAKIGDVKYADLASAINAAQAGETVTLLRNINLGNISSAIIIPKNITIDGQGYYTITVNSVNDTWNNAAFAPRGPISYTFKNVTIDLKNAAPNMAAFSMKYGGTLENVTVKGAFGKAVDVSMAYALTVTGCIFDGTTVGVNAPNSYAPYSTVTITGTTFNTTGAAAILREGAVFTDNIIAADSYVQASGYLDVSKNFWNGNNASGEAPTAAQLKGDEIICDTYYAANNKGVLSDLRQNGVAETPVIKIEVGNETYEYGPSKLALLSELLGSNTAAGAKITLLDNVTLENGIQVAAFGKFVGDEYVITPKTIEIDLNGKTLNGFIQINANVTAIIKNGTVNNTGNYPAIDVGGTATVEDLTVTSSKTKAFRVADSANLTVKAGTYSSDPSAYLAEGYCVKVEAGKYIVGEKNYVGVKTEATLEADAYTTYTCTHCGDSYVVTHEGTRLVAVAQIGDKKFESLQAAVNAAQSGDTVTLLTDIELTDNDIVKVGNYGVMVNVEGKSITLDMNGKTIDVNYAGGPYLYAVILVADGAELTVTGDGTIDISENGINVAYMFWKRGTTGALTIKNGIYHMNDSADSMVYTNGHEIVTVEGGKFTLDATGTRENGAPWIFNVQGAGDHCVIVTGGTYNADINRQHWSNEAVVPKTHYVVKNSDNTWTVIEGAVAYVNEGMLTGPFFAPKDVGYATLQEALDASKGEKDIVINLLDDVVLDITAWETLAIGGETTETITINGNGKTLTFNKLNSDWNHITTNNDAKLILNNMTITDSGKNNGPWNRYDLNFACDVELNDVTSTKALAFKADATLNTVTVNETGDNYAIWVQANGQTVAIDGLTVNSAGRGIKIDNQYVDQAAKVTLNVSNATFTTAKKAAILVKNPAGADITVSNVDITKVAADTENVVWNDEDNVDYFNMITVTGGTKAQEGEFPVVVKDAEGNICGYYKNLADAIAAAVEGDTIELLAPVVVNAGETLTLDKDVTITYTSDVVGEDMITVRGTLNVAAGKITYTNNSNGSNVTVSTISAEPGSVVNVTGGTIENKSIAPSGSSSYAYAIDMLTNGSLGDVTVTISGGTVYSDYMAIRQFNNGDACKNTLNVTGGNIYGAKRAIQVHLKNNAAYTNITGGEIEGGDYALCFLTTSENLTVSGGKFTGSVWYSGTDGFISGGTFTEAVTEAYCAEGYIPADNGDGTYGVKLGKYVAMIGETKYETLQAAINAAVSGQTVVLLNDYTETDIINVMPGVKLDLNGNVLTATNYVMAMFGNSHIIDSTKGEGALKVDEAKLFLMKSNEMLPVRTATGEIRFTTLQIGTLPLKTTDLAEGINCKLEFIIHQAGTAQFLKEQLATKTMKDLGLGLRVSVKCTQNGDDRVFYFYLNQEHMDGYVSNWGNDQFYMYLSGLDNMENVDIRAEMVFGVDTGAEVVAQGSLREYN